MKTISVASIWEEEMEDDEFDDNGVPSDDASSQVPEGSVEDQLLPRDEEDDNGVNLSSTREDSGSATNLSSTQEKHEDPGGAEHDIREQESTRKVDERQSAANLDGKYVGLDVEGERDVCCDDNNNKGDAVEGSAEAVNRDDPEEALGSSKKDFKDLALKGNKEEGLQRPSSDETNIGECIGGSLDDVRSQTHKSLETEGSLGDSFNKTETKTYQKPIDKYKPGDFFDTGTEVPLGTPGIEDTSTRRREVTPLHDRGTDKFDPGPSRAYRNESLNLTHQDGDARKITRQLDDRSSDVLGVGSSEQDDNRSAKSGKISSVSTKLNFATIVVFFLGFDIIRGISALTVIPEDVLASSGSIARLRCSTDYPSPVYWERMLHGSNGKQETIYYGKNGMVGIAGDRFSVEKDVTSGRYDLIIRNVHLEDAGTYTCIDDAGLGDRHSAELVVSERFICEMPVPRNGFMGENIFEIPEDQVGSTCTLTFRGHVVPRFQWTWGKVTLLLTPTVINSSTVTSSVTLRATHDTNGASLTCLPILPTTETSLDDSPRWISESVRVRYVHVEFGSVDGCQSSAMVPVCNPNCTYTSQQTPDNKCQCLAIYNDQGRTYSRIFSEQSCGMSVQPVNTVVVVVVVALVASFTIATAAAGIIIFIIRRAKICRKIREKTSNGRVTNAAGVDANPTNDGESRDPLVNKSQKPHSGVTPA